MTQNYVIDHVVVLLFFNELLCNYKFKINVNLKLEHFTKFHLENLELYGMFM